MTSSRDGAVVTSVEDDCGVRRGLIGGEGDERALYDGLACAARLRPETDDGEDAAEAGGEGG